MDWLTDELLFYGGIIVAAAAFIFLLFYVGISSVAVSRMRKQLREEYGDAVKVKK